MYRFSVFIAFILLSFSASVFAQQKSSQYDQAVSAYQSGNFIEAEKVWLELADLGDPNAQYALGIMHLKKEAQRPNDATAFQYLVEAAKQQHVTSMFNLGVAYWEGRGVKRQPEKALNWWEAAAQRNDVGAQFNLGLAYYIGEGRDQSTPLAVKWVQQAADNGHPQAEDLLLILNESKQAAVPLAKSVETANETPVETTSDSLEPAASRTPEQEPVPDVSSEATSTEPPPAAKQLVVLRAAPDARATEVNTLKPDAPLEKIRTDREWTQVLVKQSYPVWVHESLLTRLGNGAAEIKGNNVNIRPAASTDNRTAPPLGQLNDGDKVSIVLERSPWIQILPPHPFPAWVETRDLP